MSKFRKKPVVIEAFQFQAEQDYANWPQWAKVQLKHNVDGLVVARDRTERNIEAHPDHLKIYTSEGVMRANDCDWIIRGVKGEIYPCKPDIFEATYEPAD